MERAVRIGHEPEKWQQAQDPKKTRQDMLLPQTTCMPCNNIQTCLAGFQAKTTNEDSSVKMTNQARFTTIEPFVPPKPNELDSAYSIFISRAWLAQ
ncbi:hypothetical protein GCM10011450_03170 [Advenella faeciporci]|uniref:Uncharacterized protein n=1 Tax=Advenella faeciporci TaxID=797535 RepID=A0A918JEH5_9BURK|nr:hypothetical protein GCM10011450_03170 [Advenella faeciporci]